MSNENRDGQNPVQPAPSNQEVANILKTPISRVYSNGFILGNTNTDVFIICQTNGNANLVLNISFETAKLLQEGINRTLSNIETELKQPIKYLSLTGKKL